MKTVLLDTNFLLIPGTFSVDIFSELDRIVDQKYCLAVLDKTLDELKSITEKQKGKSREAARLGLQIVQQKKIEVIETEKNKSVDALTVEIANSKSFIVATQDRELKKRLKEKNVAVVVLRQKNHLELK
ncbi:MAG: PIN domain-containing protein [Candidatus Woesearchaeota archaeon]